MEFDQNVSAANKVSNARPDLITDRVQSAYVLPSVDAFRVLSNSRNSIADLLAVHEELDLELPVRSDLPCIEKFL